MTHETQFKKLLIANRGEIAIRIARAATELGIKTVGIYAYEDRFALHRYKTEESYLIGSEGEPLKAYLDIEQIVETAVSHGVDAIHPGYGFLSENADFARACAEKGIQFIGPKPEVLQSFGDKVTARSVALQAGLKVIPGSTDPVESVEEARSLGRKIGYPLTLKAVSGGGGKGIRMLSSEQELESAFTRAQSEAKTSFGKADLYIEKTIEHPKHIEVQILGDRHDHQVHLYTRDCSIQRRHQKVVEVAPALGISEKTEKELHRQAIAIAQHTHYQGLGTVEFLVDAHGGVYFLEVNPRVQVEHTVTEMITGIDLIQASILVACGHPISHPHIGINGQSSIPKRGCAIQARITTEDPAKDFAPDTGKIIAYRPATGFGIRLDEGHGTSGGTVTPYYDSLLVKLTTWGNNIAQASAKMERSLAEFRIRGVKHNIPLLKNIVKHKSFSDQSYSTHLLNEDKSIFSYQLPRDRATKLLHYLANTTINDPHQLKDKPIPRHLLPQPPRLEKHPEKKASTAMEAYKKGGSSQLVEWIKQQKQLLLTDTTMRDAHQSLFATRLRTKDIRTISPFYAEHGQEFFSLEVWGGATFDTCMRFLHEDPWDRLVKIREAIPNILLQMLLRGDNAVGYTNYPEWVVRDFIKETIRSGLDIFRIFDCLNQTDKMAVAIDEVKKQGAIAEVCVCYTGDISNPKKSKFNLDYYLQVAREAKEMGADILCIKDMAGLLKPRAAAELIPALKESTGLPIHLHTHDTSGTQVATLLKATEVGCDIVDGAVSSMSGLTSQPSLNATIACLKGDDRCPHINLEAMNHLSRYWEDVRELYKAFDPGLIANSTEVYNHEIPGGQYSNLFNQATKVGLSSDEFYQLTQTYKEVNALLGDIVKVTPSSKVVGDTALLLHKQGITTQDLLEKKPKLDYPDSLVSFCKGHMGVPYGGFPQEIRELVLGANPPPPAPPVAEADDTLVDVKNQLHAIYEKPFENDQALSYRLYPKVFKDFMAHKRQYGEVTANLPTWEFFYGLEQGRELSIELEAGKTLYITLKGMSEPDENGKRSVFFDLNGFNREITITDQKQINTTSSKPKADPTNPQHLSVPMPGKIIGIQVQTGQKVESGQPLAVTEAMKMEYVISAKQPGVIHAIHGNVGDMIEEGDLLFELG